MGRLLVFLARLHEQKVRGIGVEQGAAVLLEPDGTAKVVGRGSAYFVEPKASAAVLEVSKPLTMRNVDVQKVSPGHAYNVRTWQGESVHYSLSVDAGKITSTQAGGAVY
jgi:cyanophycinase-like exopeptidase